MKKAISDILRELIPHENKYVITEKDLLDYITNLQQKIKHYEETTTFGDYVKEVNLLVDYKSRIEKAVEYLKERERNTEEYIKTINMSRNCYIMEQEEVIDILNGRSDE